MSLTLEKFIQRLGYAGLLPFVGLTALIWLVDAELVGFVADAMLAYAAVIVSFLGGIHWGAGFLKDEEDGQSEGVARFHFVWGVVPSLLAWLALLMPGSAGLPLMGLVLLACYAVDRKTYPGAELAHWLPMRLRLTLVATVSCVLAAAAL